MSGDDTTRPIWRIKYLAKLPTRTTIRTTARRKHPSARLYLPHIGLLLHYPIGNVYAVTIGNKGLWRVAVGIQSGKASLIRFTDFKSRIPTKSILDWFPQNRLKRDGLSDKEK